MKRIIQYKNGIPVGSYRTIAEIQKKKGYCKSHISECLNGKRKTAYGYEWQYLPRRKGRLKYWFKSKKEMIKDVGFLCDRCEELEAECKQLKNGWQQEVYDKNGILNKWYEAQGKIDKAIKYLNTHDDSFYQEKGLNEDSINDLLNILQNGSDE